jgi:hypothetical protein
MSQFDIVTDLTACENDWCALLQWLQTNEPTCRPCTFITTAVKPNCDCVAQSAHVMFSRSLRILPSSFSAGDVIADLLPA